MWPGSLRSGCGSPGSGSALSPRHAREGNSRMPRMCRPGRWRTHRHLYPGPMLPRSWHNASPRPAFSPCTAAPVRNRATRRHRPSDSGSAGSPRCRGRRGFSLCRRCWPNTPPGRFLPRTAPCIGLYGNPDRGGICAGGWPARLWKAGRFGAGTPKRRTRKGRGRA